MAVFWLSLELLKLLSGSLHHFDLLLSRIHEMRKQLQEQSHKLGEKYSDRLKELQTSKALQEFQRDANEVSICCI